MPASTMAGMSPLDSKSPVALVIHGGAGVSSRESISAADQIAIRHDLDLALDAGQGVLSAGGTALDAVTAAIVVLEDSPWFNAGKGSVFDAEGRHELDASIMEGHTRRAGAVAAVTTVRNPILLSRAVMEHSEHVMLVALGAEKFADTQPGIGRVDPSYFDTDRRWQQLLDARALESAQAKHTVQGTYFGTVGAVALDAHGNIAAGTSTGGMTNKRFGRVGDSPIIGAGTYADDRCGVSGTGWGEFFIRAVVAQDICARVAYRGDSIKQAAHEVIHGVVATMGGDGGAIALDKDGNIAMPFNTPGMFRGWIRPDGSRGTAIFPDGTD
ncbi:MAG: isoaspartyl peptidase/L-asparaginase [Frankiaceae bacterium]|nr:isoaspartyl peptidase/L-asparaginase [Arenimonas sp.]